MLLAELGWSNGQVLARHLHHLVFVCANYSLIPKPGYEAKPRVMRTAHTITIIFSQTWLVGAENNLPTREIEVRKSIKQVEWAYHSDF